MVDEANDSIDAYSIKELIKMFQLSLPLTKYEISSAMDAWRRSDKNSTIAAQTFIGAATEKLLNSLKTQTRHEATTFGYDSHSVLMQLKQPKINQTHALDTIKDVLNPNFQNTVTRIINLDSQYREGSYPLLDPNSGQDVTYNFATTPMSAPSVCIEPDKLSSTEYTAYLSTTLTDVLSLKIYHISIPYVWYNIDDVYGTNFFQYIDTHTGVSAIDRNINPSSITLSSGHYNLTGDENNIYTAINVALKEKLPDKTVQFELDPLTRKTKINYYSPALSGNYFTMLWYNILNIKNENTKSNSNLGWKLGFRREISYIATGNSDQSGTLVYCIDFSGGFSPLGSSIFLEINDGTRYYNNDKTISYDTSSHKIYYKNEPVYDISGGIYKSDSSKSFTSISGQHNSPGNIMRNYPAPSHGFLKTFYKYTAISDAPADLQLTKYLLLGLEDYNNNQLNSGLISIQSNRSMESNTNLNSKKYGLKVAHCPNGTDKNYYQYNTGISNEILGITKAQLASVNAIAKHKTRRSNKKVPPVDKIFAIIRIPDNIQYGQLITDNSIVLLDNERIYFGPITIGSLKIKLMTEDGAVLNLNKMDWSFALLCKQLYQY